MASSCAASGRQSTGRRAKSANRHPPCQDRSIRPTISRILDSTITLRCISDHQGCIQVVAADLKKQDIKTVWAIINASSLMFWKGPFLAERIDANSSPSGSRSTCRSQNLKSTPAGGRARPGQLRLSSQRLERREKLTDATSDALISSAPGSHRRLIFPNQETQTVKLIFELMAPILQDMTDSVYQLFYRGYREFAEPG
ncbi:unnamed protein product, partial [Nesidiocoris tenuis]